MSAPTVIAAALDAGWWGFWLAIGLVAYTALVWTMIFLALRVEREHPGAGGAEPEPPR